jgi:amino acid permease
MLLVPLAVFYFLFYIVFAQNKDMLGWCGLAAVFAVNCVIISYVIMAFNEPDTDASAGINVKSRVLSNNRSVPLVRKTD